MFLVEHQLKTATVRPSSEQQQAWINSVIVHHEGERPLAPRPVTGSDKLDDAIFTLHRKTSDIKRLLSKSVIRAGSDESVNDILAKIQAITDEADNVKRSLRDILSIPSNSNFQRQLH